MNLNAILLRIPLASTVFLAYALIGAAMLVVGTVQYGAFADNLLAIGIACGAIGVPRAVSKLAKGETSINLFGMVESVEIPALVFLIFLVASSYSLFIGVITFGEFSENLIKVGIACGAIQATRAVEHVYEPSRISA